MSKVYHNTESIIKTVEQFKPNLDLLGAVYKGKKNEKIQVRCKVCDYYWDMSWRKIYEKSSSKSNCPCCAGMVVSEKNSIYNNRKDLLIYFKNIESSKTVSVGSRKIIDTKCPTCGSEKIITASDLCRKPYSCKICSDNVSKPEKFIISLLNQMEVQYEYQKKFEWSENRKYDFYIPSLNLIIETNGEQHYRECRFRKSLEEQKRIDIFKKGMAFENGIKNYVEINMSKDDYKYMKTNTIKSLKNYMNLNNIDFKSCYKYCLTSNISHLLELLSNGCDEDEIMYALRISRYTYRRYLNKAIEFNLYRK